MDSDRIEELLQQADERAGVPRLTPNLAGRTYRVYAQRRRVRAGLSVAASMLIVAGIIHMGRGIVFRGDTTELRQDVVVGRDGPQQAVQVEIEQLRAEVAQLRAEAEERKAILTEVLKRQERQERIDRLEALERQVRQQGDPSAEVNRLVERAALVILYQADRKYNELDLKESAIADYRQVIKLYPETRWAESARQRLADIKTQENQGKQGDVL
jgi:hypothetical protein